MGNENEEVLDNPQATPESQADTDSQKTENSSGDDTSSEQKNKSNWKELSKAKKDLERRLQEKDQELETIKNWANSLYESEEEKPFTKKEAKEEKQNTETLDDVVTFYQKNEEALDYKDEIVETMTEFGIDRAKAWKYVKSQQPAESTTKKEFGVGQKTPPTKKAIQDMNPEEAMKLSKEQKREWRKLNGFGG